MKDIEISTMEYRSFRSTPKWLKGDFLWLFGLLALALIALLPSSPIYYLLPGTDSSIFLYIGQKIRLGQFPYSNWYDHKPPLIFYINALGLTLGNGSRWGVWTLELISLSSVSLLGYQFLKRYFGRVAAAVAVSVTLLSFAFVQERGNLTEEYALPFQFAAIFLLSQMDTTKKPGWYAFGIGCMLAMASSLKQPLAGIGVSIVVYLAVACLLENKWLRLIKSIFWIGAGFILVWAAWFVYFWRVGIFPDFWEAAFQYNFALSGIPIQKRLLALWSGLTQWGSTSGFFLGGMGAWLTLLPYLWITDNRLPRLIQNIWLVFSRRAPRQWNGAAASLDPDRCSPIFLPLMIALVDLPVAFTLSSLSGNNYSHYFMALLPSLTILTAYTVTLFFKGVRPEAGDLMRPAWGFVLVLVLLIPGIQKTAGQYGPMGDRQNETLIAYVNEQTQPGDYVLQWGVAPSINLATGRDSPTRFFFADPLFVVGYSGSMQSKLLLQELQAKPPILIINSKIPRLPLITVDNGASCDQVRDPAYYEKVISQWSDDKSQFVKMPEGMDAVYYWICQNYERKDTLGELAWDVYRLKGK